MNLTCWTTQQEPSYRQGKRESFLSYYTNKDLGPLICPTAGEEIVLILQGGRGNEYLGRPRAFQGHTTGLGKVGKELRLGSRVLALSSVSCFPLRHLWVAVVLKLVSIQITWKSC